MKRVVFIFAFLAVFVASKAQDCFKYYPSKIGSILEYTQYDDKNKVTGTSTVTLKDKKVLIDSSVLVFNSIVKPANSDSVYNNDYEISCKGDKVYLDMSSTNPGLYSAYQGMRVEIEGGALAMPNKYSVGQVLDNGNMTVKIYNQTMLFMTITTAISNRKVIALESVTTPAGTFNCYKITYDMEVKMGFMTTKSSMVEWYSETYGMIKSETYDKKGKLTGSQVLSKYYNF